MWPRLAEPSAWSRKAGSKAAIRLLLLSMRLLPGSLLPSLTYKTTFSGLHLLSLACTQFSKLWSPFNCVIFEGTVALLPFLFRARIISNHLEYNGRDVIFWSLILVDGCSSMISIFMSVWGTVTTQPLSDASDLRHGCCCHWLWWHGNLQHLWPGGLPAKEVSLTSRLSCCWLWDCIISTVNSVRMTHWHLCYLSLKWWSCVTLE